MDLRWTLREPFITVRLFSLMSNPATVQSYKLSPPQSALICIFWKDTIYERSPGKLSPEIVKQFCFFFFVPGVRRQGCRCFFLSESDKGSTSATRKTILTLLIFIQTSRAKRKLWSCEDLTSLYELGVVRGGRGGASEKRCPIHSSSFSYYVLQHVVCMTLPFARSLAVSFWKVNGTAGPFQRHSSSAVLCSPVVGKCFTFRLFATRSNFLLFGIGPSRQLTVYPQ